MRLAPPAHLFYLMMIAVAGANAQDANWGKKVECYKEAGEVICPGCMSRAGLSCPRNRKMPSCGVTMVTEIPTALQETTEATTATSDYQFETTTSSIPTLPSEEATLQNEIYQVKVEKWRRDVQNRIEFQKFYYRIMKPYKVKRDKRETLEDDICEWNGDCPCPLICCRTGDGCPKQCTMGIRLPPPWG